MLALDSLDPGSQSPAKTNWKFESHLGWEQLPNVMLCQAHDKRQKSEFSEVTYSL